MRFDRNTKILIIGLGLIGGSYAAALSEKGFSVGAVEKRQSAIDFALEKGWITRGATVPTPAFLSEYDLLVLALYPHDVVRFVKENQSHFKKGALLTDVTGVKCGVVDAVQAILRPDLEFIGAHPMAGRLLLDLFHARLDPDFAGDRAARERALLAEWDALLDAVANPDEDRILARFRVLLDAVLRTNYHQYKPHISFKVDSAAAGDMPCASRSRACISRWKATSSRTSAATREAVVGRRKRRRRPGMRFMRNLGA